MTSDAAAIREHLADAIDGLEVGAIVDVAVCPSCKLRVLVTPYVDESNAQREHRAHVSPICSEASRAGDDEIPSAEADVILGRGPEEGPPQPVRP